MSKDTTLSSKKCVPCEGEIIPLSPQQADAMLLQLPGWELLTEGKELRRRLTFPDFASALAFVNKVGEMAESEGHHPDIRMGWGYAEFRLWTHALGALHENDFIIASKINALITVSK
jgi:4a-hydroxytetrahydrobiopterin dehydratase